MNKILIRRAVIFLKNYRKDFAFDKNVAEWDMNVPPSIRNRAATYVLITECINELENSLEDSND